MQATVVGCLFLLASVSAWQCGIYGQNSRTQNYGIFGGTPVNITEVPFMALLRGKNYTWGCGASIISDQFLVTAAHCLCPSIIDRFRITVGTDNVHGGEDYEIEKSVQHPKFDICTGDNDINVLKLKKKLVFNKRVQPIKLVDSNFVPKDGDVLETIGFGFTENGVSSKTLLKVKVPYVERKKCESLLKLGPVIKESMICAGGEEGKGVCNGDSGGPLYLKGHLVGTVSWGERCAEKDKPGVYGNVAYLREFIEEVIKNNS